MNFFYYRFPGAKDITGYKSDRLSAASDSAGFRIMPFDRTLHDLAVIPFAEQCDISELTVLSREALKKDNGASFAPDGSTRESEYLRMIKEVKEEILSGEVRKVVISRVIEEPGQVDAGATFKNLCEAYPSAFVFCFYTEKTGLWMGATPELLLKKEGGMLKTMALAGTMPAEADGEWDEKNQEEHEVVVEYIAEMMREFMVTPVIEKTETVTAGPVKHLQTRIKGDLAGKPEYIAQSLADRLSPTPALSGFPIYTSMALIDRTEQHDRAYYGGYVGIRNNDGDFSYYVNLRSMLIEKGRSFIYSGGGIMGSSDPDREWDETERKSMTLRTKIIKIQN